MPPQNRPQLFVLVQISFLVGVRTLWFDSVPPPLPRWPETPWVSAQGFSIKGISVLSYFP